jgi:capsular polysaccharide biosynthesis protein
MEFWTSVKVIMRRWYVVVPCLIATVAIGLYLVHQAKPSYKASGSVLLSTNGQAARPATTPSTVAGVNPYANMDQSQLAFLVSQTAGGSAFADEMVASGASSTYSVVAIEGEPAMTVSATAATPAQATSSYHKLVSLLDSELQRRQLAVGAPANALVGVRDWTTPNKALPQNAAKVKALIMVVTVGLLLTLALTFLVDALLTNRVPWSKAEVDESRGDEEDDDEDAVKAETPSTGPVAVLTHLDLDDADLVSISDDAIRVDSGGRARRPSRFEFMLPSSASRGAGSGSPESSRHAGLPAWSPPSEHPRASGD